MYRAVGKKSDIPIKSRFPVTMYRATYAHTPERIENPNKYCSRLFIRLEVARIKFPCFRISAYAHGIVRDGEL